VSRTSEVDPIKVREALERLGNHQRAMDNGEKAGYALLWFKEYGDRVNAVEVFKAEARIVAISTPHSEKAQYYLNRAAQQFAGQILNQAISNALVDFEIAEKVRRGDG
jgi:hypothetical protein